MIPVIKETADSSDFAEKPLQEESAPGPLKAAGGPSERDRAEALEKGNYDFRHNGFSRCGMMNMSRGRKWNPQKTVWTAFLEISASVSLNFSGNHSPQRGGAAAKYEFLGLSDCRWH